MGDHFFEGWLPPWVNGRNGRFGLRFHPPSPCFRRRGAQPVVGGWGFSVCVCVCFRGELNYLVVERAICHDAGPRQYLEFFFEVGEASVSGAKVEWWNRAQKQIDCSTVWPRLVRLLGCPSSYRSRFPQQPIPGRSGRI